MNPTQTLQVPPESRIRVLLSGSSGLVGSVLLASLRRGNDVVRLVRANPAADAILWQAETGSLDPAKLEGFDLVIHLAGENLASGRWNASRKKRFRDSRVHGTSLLANSLARLSSPPKALLCASAIGFYGNRGSEWLNEQSAAGSGFLADLVRDWERAAEPAAARGIRVVGLRFGMILSAEGGALKKMLLPFRLGLGGKIGSGDQFWSWTAIDDVVGAVEHIWRNEVLRGPINLVSPQPVTNLEFTRALGRVLGRPTILPMPAFAARLAFGEMADEMLLTSARVEPARLVESGYRFRHARLEDALASLLRG